MLFKARAQVLGRRCVSHLRKCFHELSFRAVQIPQFLDVKVLQAIHFHWDLLLRCNSSLLRKSNAEKRYSYHKQLLALAGHTGKRVENWKEACISNVLEAFRQDCGQSLALRQLPPSEDLPRNMRW